MPSVELISQFTALGGYAAGQAAEALAIRNHQKNAEGLIEAAGLALEAQDAEDMQQDSHSTLKQTRRWLARPLACLAAGTIGLATYAALQEPETTYSQPAHPLEIVDDHSGATRLDLGNKPSIDQINKLTAEFISKDIKVEALVASDGKVTSTSIEEVDTLYPFGDAPLNQATSLGLDKSGEGGRVLVITNGNNLGNTKELTEQAKKTDTKVFVVNVENANANPLADEQQLAKDTGGKYWDVNETNLSEVSKEVKQTLIPAEAHQDGSNDLIIAEFALLSLIAGAGYYRRQSAATIASLKSPKGE